jgi:hypothetical protein
VKLITSNRARGGRGGVACAAQLDGALHGVAALADDAAAPPPVSVRARPSARPRLSVWRSLADALAVRPLPCCVHSPSREQHCASAEFENPLLVLSASLLGEASHPRRAHAHGGPPPPHARELGTAPLRIADAAAPPPSAAGGAAVDAEAAGRADGGGGADAGARLIGDGHARSTLPE